MITWAEYDELLQMWLKLREYWHQLEGYLPNWGENGEGCGRYQNLVIKFGNTLEKGYSLAGTEVLTALEEHCEHIYQWLVADPADKTDWLDVMEEDYKIAAARLTEHCGQHVLAICAILKNEGAYIREWLEYHRLVGIFRFYLYDNESTDGLRDILQPYIEQGIVVYKEWPGTECQLSAYNDALERYRDEAAYIAFIDADEFLVPAEDRMLPGLVQELFWQEPQAGAVGVNWRVYGSSGHMKRPDGLVTESYRYRALDNAPVNRHIKSIVNPRLAQGFIANPHSLKLKEGYYCISEKGTIFGGPFFADGTCSKIRINHYHTKSKEEYWEKLKRGWPDQPHYQVREDWMEFIFLKNDKNANLLKDDIMDRYQQKLKELLK